MTASSIHKMALDALRTRTLVRLPHSGGDAASLRTEPALGPKQRQDDAIARLVDSAWKTRGEGRFDGALLGVAEAVVTEDEATLSCHPIRYRDYLAADDVLGTHPDSCFPLAVGVHAILSCGERIVCLRLANGRMALPGGAVDGDDLTHAPGQALLHAIGREVGEETGIDLKGRPLEVTGLYVGGYPTHLLAMLWTDLSDFDVARAISSFRPADALDAVRSIELHPLSELSAGLEDLPLVMRAALRSLHHWRGRQPAWTIAT